MKKNALLAVCALFSNSFFSQQWDGATNSTDHIFRNGNVSIGTNQLLGEFTLKGNFRQFGGRLLLGKPNTGFGYLLNRHFFEIDTSSDAFFIRPNTSDAVLDPNEPLPTIYSTFVISASEKVGIGTSTVNCTNCTDYRLFVKDGIKTEKVKVEIAASNGWADYVFKNDYKLIPLQDLQKYIDEKGHLPEVPTTEEAIANGIELKAMNILLLKKIEELTLYTLQQQKNIEEQSKRIEMLEKKVNK